MGLREFGPEAKQECKQLPQLLNDELVTILQGVDGEFFRTA